MSGAAPDSSFAFYSSTVLSDPVALAIPPIHLDVFGVDLVIIILPRPFKPVGPVVCPFNGMGLVL